MIFIDFFSKNLFELQFESSKLKKKLVLKYLLLTIVILQ